MTTPSATNQQQQFASCILKPYESSTTSSSAGGSSSVANDDANDTTEIPFPLFTHGNVVTLNQKGKWCITSYYFDSYGGANITLPLQLQFPSRDVLNSFLLHSYNKNCDGGDCSIQPKPINYDAYMTMNMTDKSQNTKDTQETQSNDDTTITHPRNETTTTTMLPVLGMEAKVTLTFGTGHAMTSKVERVHIVSTYIDPITHSILFYTNIIVRVSHVVEQNDVDTTTNEDPTVRTTTTSTKHDPHCTTDSTMIIIDPMEASKIKLNLEIMATYYQNGNNHHYQNSTNTTSKIASAVTTSDTDYNDVLQFLSSTEYHHHHHHALSSLSCTAPIHMTKLVPVPLVLYVSLRHALQISNLRSIAHPTIMGQTYIALTMTHGNHMQDSDPICITNVALHPSSSSHHKKYGNQNNSVVQWRFVTTTATSELSMKHDSKKNLFMNEWKTMTIHPHESHSILLLVEHQEEQLNPSSIRNILTENGGTIQDNIDSYFSRSCPLTITTTKTSATGMTTTANTSIATETVYTTNVTYKTTPLTSTISTTKSSVTDNGHTMEVVDAFHICMNIEQSSPLTDDNDNNNTSDMMNHRKNSVPLGKPFVVNVDLTNLDPTIMNRPLKLVVWHPKKSTEKDITTTATTSNSAVTAGRLTIHEQLGGENENCLLIDQDVVLSPTTTSPTAIVVRGQWRMIPLRTGTLVIPNFYIMDVGNGNMYYCSHKFQAIVVS